MACSIAASRQGQTPAHSLLASLPALPRKHVSAEPVPWHFTLASEHLNLRHLSDTSQSTPDRTRYICTVCTLWLPLPIHVDAPSGRRETTVQVQLPMKLNPLLTPRHPALAAATSSLCHPTVVFECLRIISLLHRHGRSVFQQRVLSPLSSSIRPGRGLSAARMALTTKATLTCAQDSS